MATARFSERYLYRESKRQLQTESMDSELRNGLWNVLFAQVFGRFRPPSTQQKWNYPDVRGSSLEHFVNKLWSEFLKEPIDTIPRSFKNAVARLRDRYFAYDWFEVYDLVEYVLSVARAQPGVDPDELRQSFNYVLEREMSGYRIVNGLVSPVTDPLEIAEIDAAISETRDTPWSGVSFHLEAALIKYSDRKAPDYRNSIKESVSAVEAACRLICGKPKATLSECLKAIGSGPARIHPSLEAGFDKLYGYTSDEGGIRHAMTATGSSVESEDAYFMLVACSAFTKYLIQKANRTGFPKAS